MFIPSLVYHKIDPRLEWGITTVSPKQFQAQIRYLAENQYQPLSLDRYIRGDFEKPGSRYVILTFDDSYQSIYDIAFPVLRSYNFTATLFVITDFVGRENNWDVNLGGIKFKHLTWEQIQQLADEGWEIGSHSATHPDLRKLTPEALQAELYNSKQTLEQVLKTEIKFLSYPFGKFDQRVIHHAISVGYKGGCALTVHTINDHFQIGRRGVYRWDTLWHFKLKLKNDRLASIEDIKQKAISFCAQGTVLVKNLKQRKNTCNFK